MIRKYDRIR